MIVVVVRGVDSKIVARGRVPDRRKTDNSLKKLARFNGIFLFANLTCIAQDVHPTRNTQNPNLPINLERLLPPHPRFLTINLRPPQSMSSAFKLINSFVGPPTQTIWYEHTDPNFLKKFGGESSLWAQETTVRGQCLIQQTVRTTSR